jgi:putative FmdB family regulatory protein
VPRYAYRCNSCNAEFLTMHGINETLQICKECTSADSLVRLVTTPSYEIKKKYANKVGKLTEDFIEESRENLKKQRTDLDKQR